MAEFYQEDELATFQIYGKSTKCRILVVRPAGTIDVERLSDGLCFRISGLSNSNWPSNYKSDIGEPINAKP